MTNDWVIENESRVFTIVKALIEDELKVDFPTIRFTTSNESSSDPVFPTIYIKEQNGAELAADMNSSDVNAMSLTYHVTVTVNTTKSDLKKILRFVLRAFKKLHFRCSSNFDVQTDANMYVAIASFHRTIGSDDELY